MILKKLKTKITPLLLITSFVLMPFSSIKANLVDEIGNKINKKKETIKNIENQTEKYKNIIKKLQTKKQSLTNEIDLFNAQIAQIDLEIKTTQTQIEKENLEIDDLLLKIKTKEDEIKKQKSFLKNLLREINNYDKETTLEILLKSKKFSEVFNQAEYIDTVGEKIKNALDEFNSIKKELEEKKSEVTKKKNQLEELNKKLSIQKETVNAQKDIKEALFKETKGKEYKFQNLLSDIKSQRKTILGDINELKRKMQVEIAKISALTAKPSENSASTRWYFSQNDPRWKDMTIGLSNSSIDRWGCAVTAVAMVFKYYGINIDPGILSKQPIFYRDLINWPSRWRFLKRIKKTGHKPGGLTNSDWSLIDREIANNHPVIVFIKAKSNGSGHYVVIYNKDSKGYIVNDPIMWNGQSGANIYLSTTRKYLSSIYETDTIINQMIIYHPVN